MNIYTQSFAFLNKITRKLLWDTGIGVWSAKNFWRVRSQGEGFVNLINKEEEVFNKLPTTFANSAYSEFIVRNSERWSRQPEFITVVDDVLLEPERLLGIRAGRQVVEQTIVYKHHRQYPFILPYVLHHDKADTHLEEAILYDGSATRNYYHHFVNALSGLTVWGKVGLPGSRPILISRKMFEQPFFQHLRERNGDFGNLNWYVVRDDEWVSVKKLYVVQALHFAPETWIQMRKMYALAPVKAGRRVFLNRDRKLYGRYLTNEQEVTTMLERYGFEMKYAEHLSIAEQEQLFRETEYLVALTGAGLIQQFFMDPAYGHIIELMPSNRLMPEYYWQAYALEMRYYDVVVGGAMRDGKDYAVDVPTLQQAVERMLTNQHSGRVYGLTQLPEAATVAEKSPLAD